MISPTQEPIVTTRFDSHLCDNRQNEGRSGYFCGMPKPIWKQRFNEQLRQWRRLFAVRFFVVYQLYLRLLWSPRTGTLEAKIAGLPTSTGITIWQIGANDGFTEDPLFKTLCRRSWQAVLLEPQPAVFRKLQQTYQQRRGVTLKQAALSGQADEAVLYSISISDARWATGIASMDKQQLIDAITSGYVSDRCGQPAPANPEDWIVATTIPVLTPAALRKETGTTPDLLLTDAEGMDASIVHALLDAGIQPRWIAFEHLGVPDQERSLVEQRLQQLGYTLEQLGRDTFCTATFPPDL